MIEGGAEVVEGVGAVGGGVGEGHGGGVGLEGALVGVDVVADVGLGGPLNERGEAHAAVVGDVVDVEARAQEQVEEGVLVEVGGRACGVRVGGGRRGVVVESGRGLWVRGGHDGSLTAGRAASRGFGGMSTIVRTNVVVSGVSACEESAAFFFGGDLARVVR
ncbi:MAG TPA: hypothetical protein VD997_17045 [Phycisphaerales bacterium]|nr:hypothetical protein [Phycisphaerales bacterium]